MYLTAQQRKAVRRRLKTMTIEQLEDLKYRTLAMMDDAIAHVRKDRESIAREKWLRERDEKDERS